MRSKIPVDSLKFEIQDHDDGSSSCRLKVTLQAQHRAYIRHRPEEEANELLRQIVKEAMHDMITGDIYDAIKAYSFTVHDLLSSINSNTGPRGGDYLWMRERREAMDRAYLYLLQTLDIYK